MRRREKGDLRGRKSWEGGGGKESKAKQSAHLLLLLFFPFRLPSANDTGDLEGGLLFWFHELLRPVGWQPAALQWLALAIASKQLHKREAAKTVSGLYRTEKANLTFGFALLLDADSCGIR